MKCKNCGASVAKGSRVCVNCGAVINAGDINFSDIPQKGYGEEKKSRHGFKRALAVILSLVIIFGAGAASFYYFHQKNMVKERPELSFTSGQGLINKDENVVFVSVANPAKLEFIHSVKLYEGAVDQNDVIKANQVSEDYKYTKNIDDSFRAVYFDLNELKLEQGKNYTYTFEIVFSFYNDDNRYTYFETVNFAMADKDISDVIFDHTLAETTTDNQGTSENPDAEITNDYIYDNYWYSQPFRNDDKLITISALKFSDNGTCTVTYYVRDDAGRWRITTEDGTFEIENNKINAKLDNGKSAVLQLNPKARTLVPESSEQSLIERTHNSANNADDLYAKAQQ